MSTISITNTAQITTNPDPTPAPILGPLSLSVSSAFTAPGSDISPPPRDTQQNNL